MYTLYITLFYLLLPLLLILRYIKGLQWQSFNTRYLESLGFYAKKHHQHVIWVHAVSVGEVEAAHVLIEYLRNNYPYKVLVTTGTEPGYNRVRALQGGNVEHIYLPYDTPGAVERFIAHFQPRVGIIMETEIWPVLFAKCKKHAIPVFIVNARLSEKSMHSYRKMKGFLQRRFAGVTGVVVQTEVDARRYQEIGVLADKIRVSGNIKLDMPIAESMRAQAIQMKQTLFSDRQVFIVGSTHEGEEEIFLQAYQQLKQQFPALILVLAPRQPKRAAEIKKLCLQFNLQVIARTENIACTPTTDVYLVNTLGELKQMYAVADYSFVAGSMVPIGGHNVFEPILLGVPVMFGPYMKNMELLAQQLLAAQGAIQCNDTAAIVAAVTLLITDSQASEQLINNGRAFVTQNKGALEKTIAFIDPFINKSFQPKRN
jgi:3-deoxy-D-manno-octulosonic-acid transferase